MMAARRAGRVDSAAITCSGRDKALRRRVHVETVAFEKADQGLIELPGQRHRKARRCSDRGEDGDARSDRLLDYLVARPTADDQDGIAGGQALIEQSAADHLVDCVVAANILAQRNELTIASEQAGGVESPVRSKTP